MSKFTKGILIFCGIILLLGAVLFCIGMYQGEKNNQNPTLLEDIIGDIDLSIDGAAISISNNVNAVEKEEVLEAFENIHVEAECANIQLVTGSEYQITCTFPEKEMPEFEVKNNTLQVTQDRQKNYGNTGNVTRSIVICVPTQVGLKDITLENVVGNIHIKNIKAYNCMTTLTTGNVDMDNSEITRVAYTISTGNVDISELQSEYCGVSTSTGDIDINASDVKEYVLINGVGNISLDLRKVSYDYSMDVETNVGKVYLDGEETGTDYKKENTGEYSIEIGKNVGDIHIDTK